MHNDPAVESLIEACVEAGLAAQRSRDSAFAMRREAMVRRTQLRPDEAAELGALEAEAKRLGSAFLAAQIALSAASPASFRKLLVEVKHRVRSRRVRP